MSVSNTCSICCESLNDYSISLHPEADTDNTKHIFHRTCVDKWILEKHSCPLCRKSIVHVEPEAIISLRESNLLSASLKGDIDDVKHQLNMGFLSTSSKIYAMLNAIKAKQSHIVHFFLESQTLDQRAKHVVLSYISRTGDMSELELFSEHHNLTRTELELCVLKAAAHGHIEFIKKIASMISLSDQVLGDAVNVVIDAGFSHAVPFLLEMGQIPYLSRSSAAVKLALKKEFVLVNLLLDSGPLSDVAKARVMAWGLLSGEQTITERFKHAVPFIQTTFDQALIQAYDEWKIQEVFFYIKAKYVSLEVCEVLLEKAVNRNQVLLIKELLKVQSFNSDTLTVVENIARNNGYAELYNLLHAHSKWSFLKFLQFLFGII